MAVEDIKLIHEKEAELKRLYESKLEEKKQEFINIDKYFNELASEKKKELKVFEEQYRKQKQKVTEDQISQINNETEKLLNNFGSIDTEKVNRAKKYIRDNLFK